jgi:hypothetical protein
MPAGAVSDADVPRVLPDACPTNVSGVAFCTAVTVVVDGVLCPPRLSVTTSDTVYVPAWL